MENLSHSHSFIRNHSLSRHESRLFPNKIYNSNVFSKQTKVYDDVFGAPPRFGVPPTSLSPRAEDYAEIFGCFSASRASPSSSAAASSIPVLDLPVADQSEVEFDSGVHTLEYADIFGGFSGLDFALSYEELFEPFKGGGGDNDNDDDDGCADEAWTPESEYLSEESDPLTGTASNNFLSNEDSVKLFDNDTQFINSHYRKNSSDEDMSNENLKIVNHLHSVSGIAVVVDESSPLQKTRVKKPPLNVADDINVCMDLKGEMMEGYHFRKTKSFPSNKSSGQQTFGNNSKSQRGYNYDGVHPNGTLLSVSEVSLSTCPSHVPPPSRPPPSALDSKMRDSTSFSSSHEASTNAAHDGTLSSPLFFDVEVDASSSAATSAAAMKEVMDKAQTKLRNAKELMERNNIDHMERRVGRMVDGSIDEEVKETRAILNDEMNAQKPMKTEEIVPHSTEKEKHSNAAKLSSNKEHGEDSKMSCRTERTGDWNEVAEFYEIVRTDLSIKSFGQSNNDKFLMKNLKVCKHGQKKVETVLETAEQQEENDEKAAREAAKCKADKNSLKSGTIAFDKKKNEGMSKTDEIIYSQVDLTETLKIAKEDDEKNEEDKKLNLFWEHDDFRNTIVGYKEWEEYGNLMKVPTKVNEVQVKDAVTNKHNSEQMQEVTNRIVHEDNLKEVYESKQIEKRLGKTLKWEENEERLDKAFELAEYDERLKEALEKQENKDRLIQAPWCAENEMKEKVSCHKGNENKQFDSLKQHKNEKEKLHDEKIYERVKEAFELDENEKRLNEVLTQKGNEKKRKHAHGKQDSEERLAKYFGQVQNEERLNRAQKLQENENKQDTEEREVNKMLHKEAYKNEKFQKKPNEAQEREENESEGAQEATRNEKKPLKANVQAEEKSKQPVESETEKRVKYSGELTKPMALETSYDQTKMDETECKLRLAQENCVHMEGNNFNVPDEAYELEYGKNLQATLMVCKQEGNIGKTGATVAAFADLGAGKIKVETERSRKELGAIETAKLLSDEKLGTTGTAQVLFEHMDKPFRAKDARESFPSDNGNKSSIEAGIVRGQAKNQENQRELSTIADFENRPDWEGRRKNSDGVHFINDLEKNKVHDTSNQPIKEQVEMGRGMETISLTMSQRKGNNQKIDQQFNTSQLRKRTGKNETQISEDRDKEECRRRELELERDRLRKIEEERERKREREKDRMAVEISTCDVRDQAYMEAHERTGRAAVEKANSEARQRVLAEAREKSLSEKVSIETKLKEERLAVERATAEARERAVEKAMAGKAVYDSRERVERYVANRYSSCRDDGMAESSYFEKHNIGYSYSTRHPNTSVYPGVESPQRCKARLERHQRMDERVAKALAEKNMRDLLAQREQAERDRLAENLDAEVRRWSNGKEGNLRALLSTLQYILGNDSGWQPIPLTDVITAAAVKKAYRKATLYVHPDKLQQRGASIQQRYICEKVFDLLKEAWRQFNSEER